MRKIFSASLAFSMACFLFMSCQKSGVDSAKKPAFLSSAENRAALANKLKTYFEQKNITTARSSSNGAQFIVPFFTSEGMGLANFDFVNFKLELASFNAELNGNDFYRVNPDGTYSVHVNSNTALAEYFKDLFDPTAPYLYGTSAHFDVNYTGELVEFIFYDEEGNIAFIFRFIDFNESGRAVSMHGNGKVGANGVAPWKQLSAKVVITPSGQGDIEFKLK